MAQPIAFTSETARFNLPLLFAGQAQKEFFFNEAQILIDALLHLSIVGRTVSIPIDPEEGDSWLIENGADGDWANRTNEIAVSVSGKWKYLAPRQGMRAFDLSEGALIHFDGSWQTAIEPAEPVAGSNIDTEARAAIVGLISALRSLGIFPRN